jgi:hypothetical protein
MMINQLAPRTLPLLTVTGAVGAGYTLSWLAGLSVPAPSPRFSASGAAIVAALAGHGAATATQFALTEGLPAFGIAVIAAALARATGGPVTGGPATGRLRGQVLLTAGLAAAAISFAQFVLALILIRTQDPGSAHLLYGAVNRLDGVKMLLLAVLGAATYKSTALPRWLRYTGAGLALTITFSGVVYLLLVQSLAIAAGPALLLLLLFITGAGITLGTKAR